MTAVSWFRLEIDSRSMDAKLPDGDIILGLFALPIGVVDVIIIAF